MATPMVSHLSMLAVAWSVTSFVQQASEERLVIIVSVDA